MSNDIISCIEVLEKGGLILYPTDTIWGIGCDATNEQAVAKIYALKRRNEKKSMIVLLSEEKDILHFTFQKDLTVFDYINKIPKPVTVIYKEGRNLAKNLINPDGSIAIRIVKDNFCKQLINEFKKPIVSTSSNVSGYPPPASFGDIDIKIKNGVDYIVEYRREDDMPAIPSMIVRLNDDNTYDIIRT